MFLKLIIESPVFDELQFSDADLPVVLGRSRHADVPIPDVLASRQHCRLAASNNGIFVRDLGSTNGTTLNGIPIEEAEVSTGSLIRIGDCRIRVIFMNDLVSGLGETGSTIEQRYSREMSESDRSA